jgi:hypothetical protein
LFIFFSEDDIVAAGTMWHIKGIHDEEYLKIFALWFNSTLNIIQILAIRRETRGAWIVLDDYMFEEGLMIPAIETFSRNQKKNLLELYDRIKKNEFSSILNQLQDKDPIRKEIDETFLSLLGYNDEEISSLLQWIYDAVSKEISILRKLMGEGMEEKDLEEEKFIDEYA